MSGAGDLDVREYADADRPRVVELMRRSLGERSGERTEEFFAWKHEENAFGRSYAWVAVDAGEIVGFRALMRWDFVAGGRRLRAVRAVDTCTAPTHQGRGIFRRLTMHGVEAVRAAGIDFVFNTPNAQSRPGYLAMGWQVVGRLPTVVRPASIAALGRMARARVPADLWSLPSRVGLPIGQWLAEPGALEVVEEVAARRLAGTRLQTALSAEFLRWRYGYEPLAYRVWPLGTGGGLVFRLRRRGPLVEAAVVDVLSARGPAPAADVRCMLVAAGADYALALQQGLVRGMVTLPKQGPILTARAAAAERPGGLADWRLSLGDVELF